MTLRIKFRTLYKGNLGRKIIMHNSGKMRINLRVKKKQTDHGCMCIICNLGNARHILVVPNIFKTILFYGLPRLFHSFLVKSVGRTWANMGDI